MLTGCAVLKKSEPVPGKLVEHRRAVEPGPPFTPAPGVEYSDEFMEKIRRRH